MTCALHFRMESVLLNYLSIKVASSKLITVGLFSTFPIIPSIMNENDITSLCWYKFPCPCKQAPHKAKELLYIMSIGIHHPNISRTWKDGKYTQLPETLDKGNTDRHGNACMPPQQESVWGKGLSSDDPLYFVTSSLKVQSMPTNIPTTHPEMLMTKSRRFISHVPSLKYCW